MRGPRAPWQLENKEWISLITPKEFQSLEKGTLLIDIFGETVIVGQDEIYQDTRGGFLAYGFPQLPRPAMLEDDFDEFDR
jgi:hypothetical protein